MQTFVIGVVNNEVNELVERRLVLTICEHQFNFFEIEYYHFFPMPFCKQLWWPYAELIWDDAFTIESNATLDCAEALLFLWAHGGDSSESNELVNRQF